MLAFILWVLALTLPVQSTIDSSCTAFTSNGAASSTFLNYRFYDFRNIYSSSSGSQSSFSGNAKTVADSSWTKDWYIRNYPRKSPGWPVIPVDFIPQRVTITNSTDNSSDYSTYLTLSSARINEETQEGGEITYFNISYASLRVMGRVYGTRGACAGIFTYLNDTQESDIEMFTEDPHNYVHYSNQPSSTGAPNWAPIPGATVNVSMPGGRQWTDWHIHRLDWTPGRSVFFVDGIQTNTTTLQVPSPQPPSGFYLDMWGANSTWVGEMPVGGEAWFDIQWVEMLFNTTVDSSPPPADPKLCAPNVDDTTATTAATKPTSTTSWGVRLASMDGSSLALWSLLVILMVNY